MKKLIPFILIALLTCFACQTEEVGPENGLHERQGTEALRQSVKCMPPVISWSPCDQTFRFNITRGGVVDTGSFWYTIRTTSGNLIDFGYITDNTYTSQVLNACTLYKVELVDWCVGSVIQYKTSDGCNNTYVC